MRHTDTGKRKGMPIAKCPGFLEHNLLFYVGANVNRIKLSTVRFGSGLVPSECNVGVGCRLTYVYFMLS